MISKGTFDRIYAVVRRIPKGKVLTYQAIAQMADINNPQIVGFALHRNSDPKNIPCHRVVNKQGRLAPGYAFGGDLAQKKLLKREGISFLDSTHVNLKKHLAVTL